MILFVGKQIKFGGLLEVLTNRTKEEYSFIQESNNIKTQENEILRIASELNPRFIVYDTSEYYNDGEEIIKYIKRIYRANKISPVILVPTNNPDNEIVKSAIANQVKLFVNTSQSMGDQKDEFEKILLGFYENNAREDLDKAIEQVQQEQETLNEFVTKLYDSNQRELAKEKTIVINKKGITEVLLLNAKQILKWLATVVVIILTAIGITTLIYKDIRSEFIQLLIDISDELHSML